MSDLRPPSPAPTTTTSQPGANNRRLPASTPKRSFAPPAASPSKRAPLCSGLSAMEENQEIESNENIHGSNTRTGTGESLPESTILVDLEAEEEAREEAMRNPSKKRKTQGAPRSLAWKEFTQEFITIGDPPKTVRYGNCKTCGALIKADSKANGTIGLKNHTQVCNKRQAAKNSQITLNLKPSSSFAGEGSLTSFKFNQQTSRLRLAEMIILDELPFKFVERLGFRRFIESLNPNFRIPCRETVRADCMRLFLDHKESLKSFFQKQGIGRVSITTDGWTSNNGTNYICVTTHFIKDWNLQKRIISFRKADGHKGDDIGAAVISTIEGWGLERLLCCTMDNASSNDNAIKYMKPMLENNATMVDEKYLHMRCVVHIINLIVQDGLEEIGMSVRRVREAVKWVQASSSRLEQFKEAVQIFKIDTTKGLCLDVPTRWNSTYLMLDAAEPYEKAFKWFGSEHATFKQDLMLRKHKEHSIGAPVDLDWVNIRRMCEFLGKFYDFTLLVSSTTYVTSHLFFKEICDVFEVISEFELHPDQEFVGMAERMRKKLEKYWLDKEELNPRLNKILYVAALLDPRQKMQHVEKCLITVYGETRGAELVRVVKDHLEELFAFYKANHVNPTQPSLKKPTFNTPPVEMRQHSQARFRARKRGSCSILRQVEPNATATSEIAVYLIEDQLNLNDDESELESFDILKWWMMHNPRFPIMAEMAKDILAIPISSVASECAFST